MSTHTTPSYLASSGLPQIICMLLLGECPCCKFGIFNIGTLSLHLLNFHFVIFLFNCLNMCLTGCFLPGRELLISYFFYEISTLTNLWGVNLYIYVYLTFSRPLKCYWMLLLLYFLTEFAFFECRFSSISLCWLALLRCFAKQIFLCLANPCHKIPNKFSPIKY